MSALRSCGDCTNCVYPLLDKARYSRVVLVQQVLIEVAHNHTWCDIDTWFNNLDNTVINAAVGTLGDLYNSANCMRLASGNTIVQMASMPSDAKVRVQDGCIC